MTTYYLETSTKQNDNDTYWRKNSATVLRRLQQNTNTLFDLKSEMKEPEYVV